MSLQPILLAGEWRPARDAAGTCRACNPADGQPLPEEFPVSSFDELELALEVAKAAAGELRSLPPARMAVFLETFAANLDIFAYPHQSMFSTVFQEVYFVVHRQKRVPFYVPK
jgi:2,5-dioxopentanoate dehydrogenase